MSNPEIAEYLSRSIFKKATEQQLSLETLAQKAGVSLASVKRLKKGQTVKTDTLFRILAALNLSVSICSDSDRLLVLTRNFIQAAKELL